MVKIVVEWFHLIIFTINQSFIQGEFGTWLCFHMYIFCPSGTHSLLHLYVSMLEVLSSQLFSTSSIIVASKQLQSWWFKWPFLWEIVHQIHYLQLTIWFPYHTLQYIRFKLWFSKTKRFCFPCSHLHLINTVFLKSIAMVIKVLGWKKKKKKTFKMPTQYVIYLQLFDNVVILSF